MWVTSEPISSDDRVGRLLDRRAVDLGHANVASTVPGECLHLSLLASGDSQSRRPYHGLPGSAPRYSHLHPPVRQGPRLGTRGAGALNPWPDRPIGRSMGTATPARSHGRRRSSRVDLGRAAQQRDAGAPSALGEDPFPRPPRAGHRAVHAARELRLRRELLDNLAPEVPEEDDASVRTIALVDIVSSTGFLAEAGVREAELMADAIYAAARRASSAGASHRSSAAATASSCWGRDPGEVITSALLAIHDLDVRRCPSAVAAGLPKARSSGGRLLRDHSELGSAPCRRGPCGRPCSPSRRPFPSCRLGCSGKR
jgi:hypothetical protein